MSATVSSIHVASLRAAIDAVACEAPDRRALYRPGEAITYGELATRLGEAEPAAEPRRLTLSVRGSPADVVELLVLAARGHSVLVLDAAATDWERRRASEIFTGATGPDAPPALGLCTSGTNGLPLVVDLDWDSALANAGSFGAAAAYRAGEVIWCSTPLAHLYGLGAGVIAGILRGSTVMLAGGAVGPGELIEVLVSERVAVLLSVPFLLRRYVIQLARTPGALADAALRVTIAAGEPLEEELVAAWSRYAGGPLLAHYGLTEGGHITLAGPGVGQGVGAPLPDVEARISPEGEILVRRRPPGRPYRIAGEDPPEDGWRPTGDRGHLDPAGNLHVTGRFRDRINVAGKKVDPTEVEQRLRGLEGVEDCAVAGVSRGAEEEIVAFLVGARELPDAELRGGLRATLSAYKLPRRFVHVAQIPRTPTGKIRRGQLIAALESEPSKTSTGTP